MKSEGRSNTAVKDGLSSPDDVVVTEGGNEPAEL